MENINQNIYRSTNSLFTFIQLDPDCEFYFPNYQNSQNSSSDEYDPEKMGTKLKFNRSALAWISRAFSSWFYDGVEDGLEIDKDPIYIIEDVDLKTFKKVLNFIRDGNVVFESIEDTKKLIKAGMKFQMEDLINVCVRWLQSILDTRNATEISEIAVALLNKAAN